MHVFERLARWFVMMNHYMTTQEDFGAGHAQQNEEQLNNLFKTLKGYYSSPILRQTYPNCMRNQGMSLSLSLSLSLTTILSLPLPLSAIYCTYLPSVCICVCVCYNRMLTIHCCITHFNYHDIPGEFLGYFILMQLTLVHPNPALPLFIIYLLTGEFLGYFILMQLGNGGEVNIFLQQLLAGGKYVICHSIPSPQPQGP